MSNFEYTHKHILTRFTVSVFKKLVTIFILVIFLSYLFEGSFKMSDQELEILGGDDPTTTQLPPTTLHEGITFMDSDFRTTLPSSSSQSTSESSTYSTSYETSPVISSLSDFFSTTLGGTNASESYTTTTATYTTTDYFLSPNDSTSSSTITYDSSSSQSTTFSSILFPNPSAFPSEIEPPDFCVPPTSWTTTEIVLTLIPTSFIMIFIILGNFLVIWAILTQKSLRTPSNIYILSLALTDILVGIFILPFNVYDMLNNGWELGNILCRTWLTADVTLCSSSILHISAIAVDRFRSINEGLSYAQTRTLQANAVVCGGLWFLALWIASPPVLGWNDWKDQYDTDVCALTRKFGYIVHSATGAFFIPAFVMIGVYVRIYFLLRQKFRERAEMKCLDHHSSHDLDQSSGDTGIATGNNSTEVVDDKSITTVGGDDKEKKSRLTNFFKRNNYRIKEENLKGSRRDVSSELSDSTSTPSSSMARSKSVPPQTSTSTSSSLRIAYDKKSTLQRFLSRVAAQEDRKHSEQITAIMKKKIKFSLNKERKAAKTLGILIGAFVICWTPFTMTYLLSGVLPKCYIGATFFQTVTWLGYVNSALNPVIYNMFSSEFKTAFKKIVC